MSERDDNTLAYAFKPSPMTTRDVVRWNFAPWDLLLVAGIALAGFGMGVLDVGAGLLERAVDGLAARATRGGR